MKGFALLALEAAFLFSVQLTPSRDEAAAQLWPNAPAAAPGARTGPQEDEPCAVEVKDPKVVAVRG